MSVVSRNGTTAYIGLPEREAAKLQDLWQRDEVGVELSVEVKAPVVVGVYPMRVARFVLEQASASNLASAPTNGHATGPTNGQGDGFSPHTAPSASAPRPAPEPMRQPHDPSQRGATAE